MMGPAWAGNFRRYLGFAAIALCVWSAYRPSLEHVPRGDQVLYLAEVSAQKTWFDLAIKDYDLNRTRIYAPGDDPLFRPLLYFILGTEKFLFGYNFEAWQFAGIVMHLFVVFWFLKVCLELCPGLPAYAATFAFALFFSNMEMVTWQHVGSYMISATLLLASVYHALKLTQGGTGSSYRLGWILFCLFVSGFIYEFTHMFALLLVGFLWQSRPDLRRWSLLLLLPVLAYFLISMYNLFAVHHFHPVVRGGPFIVMSVYRICGMILWWLHAGFFSQLYPVYYGFRTAYAADNAFIFKLPDPTDPIGIVSLLLPISLVALFLTGRVTLKGTRARIFVFLVLSTVAYVSMVALGRHTDDMAFICMIVCNMYYHYFFWLLAWLCMMAAIDWGGLCARPLPRWLLFVGVGVMIIGGVWQGREIYESAAYRAASEFPTGKVIAHIEQLRKGQGKEFSFYSPPSYPSNDLYEVHTRDGWQGDWPYLQLLYPQYFREDHPLYRITVSLDDKGRATINTVKESPGPAKGRIAAGPG